MSTIIVFAFLVCASWWVIYIIYEDNIALRMENERLKNEWKKIIEKKIIYKDVFKRAINLLRK